MGTAEKVPPSELQDTTGAGDSFIGAVLYGMFNPSTHLTLSLSLSLLPPSPPPHPSHTQIILSIFVFGCLLPGKVPFQSLSRKKVSS